MKIIVCGCSGKMGKCTLNLLNKSKNFEVVAGVDKKNSEKFDFKVFDSIEKVNVKADVIIDFSHPSALENILDFSVKNFVSAVICTTGFSEIQVKKIKEASKKVPIFYSRNMSLGINLLLDLAEKATKFLGTSFDIEIIEKHHNQKIDAPSGTALMIAEKIKEIKPAGKFVFERTQKREKRSQNEIGIHCVRGGNICGDHEIIFAGENETISISHHAQSKEVFACGAIKAAEFLFLKPAGLYTMQDMIRSK